MHVLAYSLTGEFLDSLVSTPGWQAYNSPTRRLRNVPIPFAHSSSRAVGPGGVMVGLSERNEIRFYTFDGRLNGIIRNVAPAGPRVESEEVSKLITRAVETAPPGMSADLRALYEEMPIPERKPPFTRIYGWRDGSIWVSISQGDQSSRQMLILDESDGRSAWLLLPSEFSPHEVGDESVLGIWTDELGVETIREYHVERGADLMPVYMFPDLLNGRSRMLRRMRSNERLRLSAVAPGARHGSGDR